MQVKTGPSLSIKDLRQNEGAAKKSRKKGLREFFIAWDTPFYVERIMPLIII